MEDKREDRKARRAKMSRREFMRAAGLVGAGIVAAVLLLVVIASLVAGSRCRSQYEAEKAGLLVRGKAGKPAAVDASRVSALPAPVRRYLEVTGARSRPGVRVAVVGQTGAIRMAPESGWVPFKSEQVYSMDPPGFLWFANARAAPLVHIYARDRFVDGRGHMLVRLLGFIRVADATGPTLDQGAGLRFWSEAIAFPETLTSRYIRWQSLGPRRVRMTVDQDGLKLTGDVEFDAAGFMSAFRADRYRDVNGKGVLTPWTGISRGWKMIDGRLFPSEWEALWHYPTGDFSYIRLFIHSVRTE